MSICCMAPLPRFTTAQFVSVFTVGALLLETWDMGEALVTAL